MVWYDMAWFSPTPGMKLQILKAATAAAAAAHCPIMTKVLIAPHAAWGTHSTSEHILIERGGKKLGKNRNECSAKLCRHC